ncbi:MAG: glycosyltransferase family 2 protein [Candidatus Entotheonellia bacterium]
MDAKFPSEDDSQPNTVLTKAEAPSTILYSVIIPVYNEAEVVPTLYWRLTRVMEGLGEPYEIIFVDDGSRDDSPALLRELWERDKRVRFLSLSRNFGHQIAITAGLDHSSGQAVIVMDADLQDPPEVIPQLIEQWRKGYDIVFAVREQRRGDGLFKRATAALFYRLFRHLSATDIPIDAGDFRLMSRRAVEALKGIRERNRFIRGLAGWIGFPQTSVPFVRDVRHAGETKYPLKKMVRFAFNGIISFSLAPLQLAGYLGFVVSATSFVYMAYAVWLKLFTDRVVLGWTSVMVAVLFLGGVQLISLGIIGEYLGRIYEEVKQRPLYIIGEAKGFESHSFDRA